MFNRNVLLRFQCTGLCQDSKARLLATYRESDSMDGSFPTCLQSEACEADGEKCQLLFQSTECIIFIRSANRELLIRFDLGDL